VQGLPLILGSFGTLTILLFGRPEAEAVRLWPLVAGQLGSIAIALSVLQLLGTGIVQRAVAMGATVAYMMWSDCIHPPGGEYFNGRSFAAVYLGTLRDLS
jgi:CBS-domain-containing membrane protein